MGDNIPIKSADGRARIRAKKSVRRSHSDQKIRKNRFSGFRSFSSEPEVYPRDNEEEFPTSGPGWTLN